MKRAIINDLTSKIIILGKFHTVAKPYQSENLDTEITGN